MNVVLPSRERELQMEKQRMTKHYIEEFKHAQEEWKRKEKEAMEEENKKILAFANVQKEREEAQKAEKQARSVTFQHSHTQVLYDMRYATLLEYIHRCCMI